MEIAGLPLHPLVVHAAVVLGPLAALVALAWSLRSGWQPRLRLPLVGLSAAAAVALVAAYLSGDALLESRPALASKPLVGVHEQRAQLLLWLTLAFAPVAVVAGWGVVRGRAALAALRVVVALLAVALLVQVVLVGDAGARAVWGSV